MKKVLLIASLLSGLLSSAIAKWRISPYAGINVSRYHYHSPFTPGLDFGFPNYYGNFPENLPYTHNSSTFGYILGCDFEGHISNHLFFQFGAAYLRNKFGSGSTGLPGFSSNAVTLPFYLVCKTGQIASGRFLFGAGPFISVNFGGKTDGLFGLPGENMPYNNGGGTYGRYDIGLCGFTGYELADGLNFKVTYKQGFLNQNLDGPSDKLINSNLSLTAGYFIGRKHVAHAN